MRCGQAEAYSALMLVMVEVRVSMAELVQFPSRRGRRDVTM